MHRQAEGHRASGSIFGWIQSAPRRYGRVTKPGTYVPQIDGLRFLAIGLVVVYHALFRAERAILPPGELHQGAYAYIPNGVAGVELFFFISGYIIAFPFLNGNRPSLSVFYKRRLTRLEPPYLLTLLLCFIIVTAMGGRIGYAPQFEKSEVSFLSSFLASCVYLHGLLFGAPPRLNPPMWSLEIEIQFYLLAPFIIAAYLKLGDRARRMAIGLAASLVLIGCQVILPRLWEGLNFTVLCNGYAFILGIVLCDDASQRRPFQQASERRFDFWFFVGMALFLFSASTWYPWVGDPAWGALNILIRAISIILLYVGASRGTLARRLLGLPWLALIGGACYSIYLVHVPVMQAISGAVFRLVGKDDVAAAFILALVILVPISLLAGMTYYLFVERPCMRHDWPQRAWRRLTGSTVETSR